MPLIGVGHERGRISNWTTTQRCPRCRTAIPAAAKSTISVTNAGTINSGTGLNPVGLSCCIAEGTADGLAPAGILAGYGIAEFTAHANGAAYQQCSQFGCATMIPTGSVNGTVNLVNYGTINAAGGNGILGFNFGAGNVSVASTGPINVLGPTSANGIEAFSAGVGSIAVTTNATGTITSAGLNPSGGRAVSWRSTKLPQFRRRPTVRLLLQLMAR